MARGKGIPWDQDGATPLEDIYDLIQAALEAKDSQLEEFHGHIAFGMSAGASYAQALQSWSASHEMPLFEGLLPQVLGRMDPQTATVPTEGAWAAAGALIGGAWLEFTTEPFERL